MTNIRKAELGLDANGNLKVTNDSGDRWRDFPGNLLESNTVVLDHETYKTLPTTPVVLLSPTESWNYGNDDVFPTKIQVPTHLMFVSDTDAALYSAPSANMELKLCFGDPGDLEKSLSVELSLTQQDYLHDFFRGLGEKAVVLSLPVHLVGYLQAQWNLAHNGVSFYIDNKGEGDLTEGDPANTLTVTVSYMTVKV